MAEQQFCPSCGLALTLAVRPPLVKVGTYAYHAICYVMKEAPSAKAGHLVN